MYIHSASLVLFHILLFSFQQIVLALPINSNTLCSTCESSLLLGLTSRQVQNDLETAEYFQQKVSKLNIIKTTVSPNGQIIDWIPLESQGKIASSPPKLVQKEEIEGKTVPRPLSELELELEAAELGPEGSVPIPRQNLTLLDHNKNLRQRLSKSPYPSETINHNIKAAAAANPHWYASSAQAVINSGGSASFSLFNAYVESRSDFSLMQMAVIRTNVPKPGDLTTTMSQTLEAGWINYPAQVAAPHLFTYYTTNGYTSNENLAGGWNTDVSGWVQVDATIFPGTAFGPLSTVDGIQSDMQIKYQLREGNWWLWVLDRWIGYYPASLFSANAPNASATLAAGSNQINFYGEIYQSEVETTTSDMGSGEFPEAGLRKSAYMRNIVYTDTEGVERPFDGSGQLIESDTSRYRIAPSWNSGTAWGSFAFLGGPGAGGVVGG